MTVTTSRNRRNVFVGTLVAGLLVLGVGVGFAQSVSFNSVVSSATGEGPLFVATGDFNGDGKLDVAVPSSSTDTVSILLGSGSGTFGPLASFSVGSLPDAVAVGDFNGDGKQDLAVANASSNNVSILLGVGNGTFGAATNVAVGTNPEMVVAGDFNGDGRQDLAVTNFASNNITILLGNGSGGFAAAAGSPVAVGTNPFGIAVGDFNGDGRQDLAVTNLGGNTVTVLLGNGSGGFAAAAGSPVAVGTSPISVGVGDFNGDGRQDLAVANFDSDNVTILLGNGSGGFAAAAGSPFPAGDGPRSVAAGDFNGDGRQDLAVAAFNDNTAVILLGAGNGTFGGPAHFSAGASPAALALGDFNVDGKLDVVTTNNAAGTVGMLLNSTVFDLAGAFGAATDFAVGANPEVVVAGDFNGDGRQDLAVTNFASNNITILLGNGSGGFAAAAGSPVAVGTNPFGIAVGDFNGDGRQDLAVTNLGGNTVTILLGNGSGGFAAAAGSPVAVGTSPISVGVGDFNGDGRQDLAVANFDSDNVTILLGNGSGGFAAAAGSPFPAGDGPRSVAAGDFNGDGRQDLAVAAFNDNTAVILLGAGNGTFGGPAHFSAGASPAALALGDFNVDGKLDVVTANNAAGTVGMLLGNGDGTLGAATGFPAGDGPLYIAVADFNRDGKLDVVVPSSGDNSVSVLFGMGNGSFVPFTSFAVGDLPDAVAVGDFNGDGRRDLAATNAVSNNLSVLLNTAPPAVTLAINDASANEGNAGNVNAVFTVTLSQASSLPVAVSFATASGTATAGTDYVSNSGVLTFTPGETSKPITVAIIGDTIVEPDQTFFVNLTNPINATITDGQGLGTIINDDVGVPSSVLAAVLPTSRSVQVGVPATAFATIINAGQTIAAGCSIAPLTIVPASFIYQTTDPATNQVTGSPNTPVDIAAGGAQSFVFALTPTGAFAPTDVQFTFNCANADSAPINVGLNTLLLSASSTPVPDIVALGATLSNDGIVTLASTGVFAVATVNVGATGTITASADTGNAILPVDISLCETNPATGQCISAIGSSVTTQINANATPTFGIFVQGNGNVPFDPAGNRIFVRFQDGGGVTRGSTSVAVRTQ